MIELGLKIKELREKNNLTQRELAKKLNISFQSISKWERGESEPGLSHIKSLSLVFHVSTDMLLGLDQTDNRKKGDS